MNEELFKKICIATAMIGMCILFFYSNNQSFDTMHTLETAKIDTEVALQGYVTTIRQDNKTAFITISHFEEKQTPVVLFKSRELWLQEGDYVEITGTVTLYEGEKELIANKIEVKGK